MSARDISGRKLEEEQVRLLFAGAAESLSGIVIAVENGVSSRKQAKADAQTNLKEIMTVLENSPDCMTLLDAEACLLYMNEGGK